MGKVSPTFCTDCDHDPCICDIEDGDIDGCIHGVPWCEQCPECDEEDGDED